MRLGFECSFNIMYVSDCEIEIDGSVKNDSFTFTITKNENNQDLYDFILLTLYIFYPDFTLDAYVYANLYFSLSNWRRRSVVVDMILLP